MIDISSKVFTTVANAVENQYSSAFVSSEYVGTPASFPCVTITEDDNYVYTRSISGDTTREHHANIMYNINIYSNKASGKKAEALGIAKVVDDTMADMGFTRTARAELPNVDSTIFRYTLRYEGIVSEGETVGDDTVYIISKN